MIDVFDLGATLTLDSSKYDSGLMSAEGKGKSFASGALGAFKSFAKMAGVALTGATTAVVAFGKKSVEVGAQFDKSMSQVAATMGMSVDDIKNNVDGAGDTFNKLRDFAQEMGSTTAFSASQAADALNYMALAGYDAEKSMRMLPNVLNLAAAGNMDLARASDMVTDAASALGLSEKETTALVDKLAKGSSKANASVEQLGEAMLRVGGTAKGMKGGTTELSAALGILADNGTKGAEGGTALRNVLLGIQGSKFEKTFGALGISAYDAEGNLRSLKDVFQDMNVAMEGWTDEKKNEAITSTFNKPDLKNINALLATTTDRWDELSAAIDDSKGSAAEMAETQLDNLAGDITLFQSALEGAQIAISDGLSPSLRQFVQFGSEGLSNITKAIKSDGMTGAMNEFTSILSKGIGMLAEKAPMAAKAGMQLLHGFVRGILDNSPTIIESGVEIVTNLVQGITEGIPEVLNAITANLPLIANSIIDGISNIGSMLAESAPVMLEAGINLIHKITDGIAQGLPELLPKALDALVTFSDGLRQGAGDLISAGLELIVTLVSGIIDGIPKMIETIPTIISNIANIINDNAPKLIEAGVNLIVKLGVGLIKAIPTLIANIPKIIKAIFDVWTAVNWVQLGTNAIKAISTGVKNLVHEIPNLVKGIAEKAGNFFKNINWSEVGSHAVTAILNGVKNLATTLVNGLKTIGTDAFNAFKNINWLELGGNIVKGLIQGIVNLGSSFITAIINLAKGAFDAIKNFFGIKSPSKKMRDEIGKNIVKGMIQGIDDEKKNAKKSAEELGSLYITAAKKKVEALKANNELSLQEEWAYWLEVREHVKKGTKAYDDATKMIGKAKKNVQKGVANAEKAYIDGVQKITENLDKEIEKLEKAYNDAVEKRKNDILGQMGLFKEFKADEGIDSGTLTANLQGQINALEQWDKVLTELESKIGGTELFDTLEGMGVSSLTTLQNLNNMTSEELTKYMELYNKKNSLAQARAEHEHEDLKATTDEQIRDLRDKADDQMEALETQYKKDIKQLGLNANKAFNSAGKYSVKGMQKGMNEQMDVLEVNMMARARALAEAVRAALEINSPSRVFARDVGRWIPLGIEKGFEDTMPEAESGIMASIEEMKDNITKGMDVSASIGGLTLDSDGSPVMMALMGIYQAIMNMPADMQESMANALEETTFSINNREFARLVKAV